MKAIKGNKTPLVLPKNIKIGESVYHNSNWYFFQGFVDGKPQLKRDCTYKNSVQAIKEYNETSYWAEE